MRGLIHIYCGDGKGKTTAAIGLAVRCCGAGEKVLLFQFLKENNSSERKMIEKIENITVIPGRQSIKFVNQMTEEEKAEMREFYKGKFEEIKAMVKGGGYRMLVMDEMIATVNCGFVTEEELLEFLKEKPEELEVVMTGREPKESLCKMADYITEMKMIKHPYEQGIPARKAIEF